MPILDDGFAELLLSDVAIASLDVPFRQDRWIGGTSNDRQCQDGKCGEAKTRDHDCDECQD